jgi:hypothetical protein
VKRGENVSEGEIYHERPVKLPRKGILLSEWFEGLIGLEGCVRDPEGSD